MKPDLVLLDLNLPKVSGREVLAEIKADTALRLTPVVILTSSDAESDLRDSFRLGASSYLIKPATIAKWADLALCLCDYWFILGRLPR
jgi:CheY-like chemotaxis protein